MSAASGGTRSIIAERHLDHPPEKVWRALTDGTVLGEWLMQTDFRPVVGHRFTFRADPVPNWSGVTEGEVLEVAPYERLVYSWRTSGAAADELHTTVTWTLTPTQRGVLLRMEQTGFRPEDGPNFRGLTQGWGRFIGQLEELLATADSQTI